MTDILQDKDQLITQVAELDFLDIRQSFIDFLQTQPEFTDFNFEGSNLSALIDVLAYDTHYNAMYLNALASEMFLGTAVHRNAAVARARQLGYTPRSSRAASASLNINLISTATIQPNTITIPAGTKFTSAVQGERFTFTTLSQFSAQKVQGTSPQVYRAENVLVYEGVWIEQTNVIDAVAVEEGVELSNTNIDTSTLQVLSRPTESSATLLTYTLATDVARIGVGSSVYFLTETDNLRYRVSFGDGIIGRAVQVGNVVTTKYLVTKGVEANGAQLFSMATPIADAQLSAVAGYIGIEVASVAAGGASVETVPSIKANAPLSYQAQRRAVTARDYAAIVRETFTDIKSVNVWGGEDNDPIALGYVFISILPFSSMFLTEAQKSNITTQLRTSFSPLAITPIIVDPDFVYIHVTSTVRYDSKVINAVGASVITSDVKDAIVDFGNTIIGFGNYLRYSRLVSTVDDVSPVITNSLTEVAVGKRALFSNTEWAAYQYRFYNPLTPGTLSSEPFSFTSETGPSAASPAGVTYPFTFLSDDSSGNVKLIYEDNGELFDVPGYEDIGDIDYENGVVTIPRLKVDEVTPSSTTETIKIFSTPSIDDVFAQRNSILVIDSTDVSVFTVPDIT